MANDAGIQQAEKKHKAAHRIFLSLDNRGPHKGSAKDVPLQGLTPFPCFFPPAWATPPPLPHARLLDDLIRKDKQHWGERDPQSLRRLAVED